MNKQGCSVPTNDAPTPFRVIDMDHSEAPVKPSARKCDYLFLAADTDRPGLLVVPLELKSTGLNPAGCRVPTTSRGRELQNRSSEGSSPVRFVPVAVHGGRVHRRAYQELRKKRVSFRGMSNQIVTMPCGNSLDGSVGIANCVFWDVRPKCATDDSGAPARYCPG